MEIPSLPEISWNEAIQKLAATDVLRMMRRYWQDELGDETEEMLANFCLMRGIRQAAEETKFT